MAEELDYVPMPDNVVERDPEGLDGEIKDAGGKPLFTPTH